MLRGGQRIFTGNIKLIKAHIMEEHIDTAQVVGRDVYLLSEKAVANGVTAQYLFRLQQQRTGAAGGIYKNAVFDTNRKSLFRHISAEKGLK